MPVLFRRPLDRHQMGFALGEALAHLHYLMYQGALERMLGADGVDRFIRAAASEASGSHPAGQIIRLLGGNDDWIWEALLSCRGRSGRVHPGRERRNPAEPIRIGFGMALTGGLAAAGKSALLAMQIWQDDVNAKGGLSAGR